MKTFYRHLTGLTLVVFSLGFLNPAAAEVTLLSRAAVVSDTGNAESLLSNMPRSVVSGDGRFVAFLSKSSNLVSGQSGPPTGFNLYLFDRLAATTRLVSRRHGTVTVPAGVEAESKFAVSRNGSCVVFTTSSAEIVENQAEGNTASDVFVYEVSTGQVTLVSHAAGVPARTGDAASLGVEVAVSHDCRYITYTSYASNLVGGQIDPSGTNDVFRFDRQAGANTLVSHRPGATTTADGNATRIALSGDGRFVAFTSTGSNLVGGQVDTNQNADVFLFDGTTGVITLVSHASGSAITAGNSSADTVAVSADGAYVAFASGSTDLVAGYSAPFGGPWDVYLFNRATGVSELVSRSAGSATTSGTAPTGFHTPSLSDDGRYVAFVSLATNLVPGQVDSLDQGATADDVFLFDRVAGTTVLVSHTGLNAQSAVAGNRSSNFSEISGDGGSVTFVSRSPLGYADNEDETDVFLYRRDTGAVSLVSRAYDTPNGVALGSSLGPAVSADGRFVAYMSHAADIALFDTNGAADVFLYDRASGGNSFVSRHAADSPSVSGSGASETSGHTAPQLSADGRYAAFLTQAANVLLFSSPFAQQLVVADRLTGARLLASRSSVPPCPGCPADRNSAQPALSADGGRIAFMSTALNLGGPIFSAGSAYQIFSHALASAFTRLVSHTVAQPDQRPNGDATEPVTTADGWTIAFQSTATDLVAGTDTNGAADVFVEPAGEAIRLVSHAAGSPTVAANGSSAVPRISADGRYIAFQSEATDLVSGVTDVNNWPDVFLHDRATGSSILVSHARGSATTTADSLSVALAISREGRFVLFLSRATDLVAGQVDLDPSLDVFLFDRLTGENRLVSRMHGTAATATGAVSASLSADGRFVAFWSRATVLVAGQVDTANTDDLFLFDALTGDVTLASRTAASMVTAAHGLGFGSPAISADGRFLAWTSEATNVVAGQVDGGVSSDLFVYDRQTGANRLVSRALGTGATATGGVSWPAISADGRSILFTSTADNLVANDRNGVADVFLDRAPTTPGAFFTLPPCRVADTRAAAAPLASDVERRPALFAACGIPSTATAVSVNVTVVAGDAAGFLSLFPGDQRAPATSTLNFRAGQVKANNAVARLALDGSGTLGLVAAFAGDGSVHVILDVNGYFE